MVTFPGDVPPLRTQTPLRESLRTMIARQRHRSMTSSGDGNNLVYRLQTDTWCTAGLLTVPQDTERPTYDFSLEYRHGYQPFVRFSCVRDALAALVEQAFS
eukprot:6069950-Amphidinium_carterae.1